jgi:hypothetical protein
MPGENPMDIIASLVADTDDTTTESTATDTVVEDSTDDASVDTTEAVESTDVDETPEATEEPVAETLYAGKYKTPEELENAYKHAEQRMHAEAQARAQYEQYVQQLEEQRAYEQKQYEEEQQNAFDPFASTPTNMQELVNYTYEEPEQAFWFAAQNAPNAVARVVSEIRQFDPVQADQLIVDYQRWQLQETQEQMAQQYQQQQEQLQQYQTQAQMPYIQAQAANAVAKAHQQIASLDNYDVLKDEMATIIRERPNLINMESESTLALGLRDVYDLAVARNGYKIQAANTAREQAAGNAGAEAGGFNSANEVEEEDPVADMKASIFGSINGFTF